jgi:hypothetical protein
MSDGARSILALAEGLARPEAWPIVLSVGVLAALTVLAIRERPRGRSGLAR